MEARELRIGNYVTGAKGAKYNGDTVKWNIGDYIECNKYCDYIDSFRPIPITEEWLIKLGFEKTNSSLHENKNAYQIKWWGRFVIINDVLTPDEYYFLDGLNVDIKYVHQLQNLYFALTGKELETNEH